MRGCRFEYTWGSFHTGNDLDWVQEEKEISTPEVQSYYVEVPGRNGKVNLTTALTGSVCFNNRDIKLKYCATGSWVERLQAVDMINRLHGQTVRIFDDDTPGFYYIAEVYINTEMQPGYTSVLIEGDAQPFRYATTLTTVDITLSGTFQTITLTNAGQATPLLFTKTGTTFEIKNEKTSMIVSGAVATLSELPAFMVLPGSNTFQVKGSGTLSLSFREAII